MILFSNLKASIFYAQDLLNKSNLKKFIFHKKTLDYLVFFVYNKFAVTLSNLLKSNYFILFFDQATVLGLFFACIYNKKMDSLPISIVNPSKSKLYIKQPALDNQLREQTTLNL